MVKTSIEKIVDKTKPDENEPKKKKTSSKKIISEKSANKNIEIMKNKIKEIPKQEKKSQMKELTKEQLEWLNKKYYDDKFLFGRDRLFHLSKQEETGLSRRQIMKWLNLQEVHQKFLKTKRTKHIKATILSEPHKQIGIDLIDMSDMSYDGFNWILTAIDLFSKKAFAVPVKTKTAKNVADGLKKILTMYGTKVSSIRSDNGSEFKAELSKFLNKSLVCLIYHKVMEKLNDLMEPLKN